MKQIILSFIFVAISTGISAQNNMPTPVSWTFSFDKESSTLLATAEIEKGWVIYSQHSEEGGPVPTYFEFEDGSMVEFEEKAKVVKAYDENFEITVSKIKGRAEFIKKMENIASGTAIKGYVTYMACDGEKCLPPVGVPFEVKT
ncbi:MAG: hypothetical protein HKN09_13035 [Saprospiraceae bacterium]|nr:hypothetical protein [Saprospiraceae bacterium]